MSEAMTSLWQPRGAWEGTARIGRHGAAAGPAGIRLSLREGFGLATLIAAEGKEAGLQTALADRFSPSLPEAGTAIFEGETGLVWSAPGQWLAVAPSPCELRDWPEALHGVASVTDQSDSRALVRISGPQARAMLAKGVAIDLHPRAFGPGRAAVTSIAHLGVQLWQRDAGPTYDLTVARSFAGSFWRWLEHAAAEFGYEVEGADQRRLK
ncbi:sarcosine oxidase subunit gamma [Methylorubrum extorquens]|uniref:sarcosine oxidase subunit gamma n=1 Tax=Methylorubrum extorquens TaxID=408 RepID=UPI000158F01B|nr:sarcosine oxidase subunit gamma family protein [Methylorubrum extorquens]ABY30050.1 Sarcosine oxidase gamma subunit [Methylorubrum extorquens PA1]KQP93467.1 sarcosine oxidase subunit gamma [Methylobacterium sp. Leaf119]WIU41363.1 sarcosine oxidase subunit gamma [Methylorubrum extorquens]